MAWTVILLDPFRTRLATIDEDAQDAIYTDLTVLEQVGPQLGRPYVDTLNGSKHANMKELRTRHDGHQFRIAFAFDPQRRAIILTGGDKAGANQRRFYQDLVKHADELFTAYLKPPKHRR
jgi:hypothetical protein